MKSIRKYSFALLLAVCFLAVAAVQTTKAADIYVPYDYGTIAEAFANANAVDTIILMDGDHYIDSTITVDPLDQYLTLRSFSGDPGTCVVHLGSNPAFSISAQLAFNVTGITFHCNDTGASYDVFRFFWTYMYDAGDIVLGFKDCIFNNTYASGTGSAIVLDTCGDWLYSQNMQYPYYLDVDNCSFINTNIEYTASCYGMYSSGWLWVHDSDFTGYGNLIDLNYAWFNGFGVTVNNSTFTESGTNYGIYFTNPGEALANDVNFTLAWNNFTGNAVYLVSPARVEMWGNVVSGACTFYRTNLTAYANNFTGASYPTVLITAAAGDAFNFTHNNFYNALFQRVPAVDAISTPLGSSCYFGYNWYADYTGADANGNGIGDTPYPILNAAGTQNYIDDNYPLMAAFNWGGWPSAAINFSTPMVNTTHANYPCLFSINMSHPIGIAGYIISYNGTGSWVNGSFVPISSTFCWGNFTKTLPAAGTAVAFQWYANTTNGTWYNSGIWYFTTTVNTDYVINVIDSGFVFANTSAWLNYTLTLPAAVNASSVQQFTLTLSDGIRIAQNPAYNATWLVSDPLGYCKSVEGYPSSYVVVANSSRIEGFINITLNMNHPSQFIYAVAYSVATNTTTDGDVLTPWDYWATFQYMGSSLNASYGMYYITELVSVPQVTTPTVQFANVSTAYTAPTSFGMMGAMLAGAYSGAGGWGSAMLLFLPLLLMLIAGRQNAAIVGMLSAAICAFVNAAVGFTVYSTSILGVIAFVCLLGLFAESRGRGS